MTPDRTIAHNPRQDTLAHDPGRDKPAARGLACRRRAAAPEAAHTMHHTAQRTTQTHQSTSAVRCYRRRRQWTEFFPHKRRAPEPCPAARSLATCHGALTAGAQPESAHLDKKRERASGWRSIPRLTPRPTCFPSRRRAPRANITRDPGRDEPGARGVIRWRRVAAHAHPRPTRKGTPTHVSTAQNGTRAMHGPRKDELTSRMWSLVARWLVTCRGLAGWQRTTGAVQRAPREKREHPPTRLPVSTAPDETAPRTAPGRMSHERGMMPGGSLAGDMPRRDRCSAGPRAPQTHPEKKRNTPAEHGNAARGRRSIPHPAPREPCTQPTYGARVRPMRSRPTQGRGFSSADAPPYTNTTRAHADGTSLVPVGSLARGVPRARSLATCHGATGARTKRRAVPRCPPTQRAP
ncbi:hypothetical protein C8J57DRAFT_1569986 [Mycena rebaudengoi]|nr:hypothetical protein C8J57DRAFT_1569986 [Mycena rebaudengoi]